MKNTWLALMVCVLLFIGCSDEQRPPLVLNPPQFYLGDVVATTTSESIGVVTKRSKPEEGSVNWNYTVMFQEVTLPYTEDQLRFVEHFDWMKEESLGPKGEIESGDELP